MDIRNYLWLTMDFWNSIWYLLIKTAKLAFGSSWNSSTVAIYWDDVTISITVSWSFPSFSTCWKNLSIKWMTVFLFSTSSWLDKVCGCLFLVSMFKHLQLVLDDEDLHGREEERFSKKYEPWFVNVKFERCSRFFRLKK